MPTFNIEVHSIPSTNGNQVVSASDTEAKIESNQGIDNAYSYIRAAENGVAEMAAGDDNAEGSVNVTSVSAKMLHDTLIELNAPSVKKNGAEIATQSYVTAYAQPLDSDLTAIAGLTPSNDDVIQRKSGSWVNRTIAQLWSDLKSSADALYVSLAGSYANPSWITSLAWSKITGAPEFTFKLQGAATATNPGDLATHAFADANVGTITAGYSTNTRIYVGKNCTLKKVHVYVLVAGALGSAELASFYLVKNGATDVLVSNAVPVNALSSMVSNTSLSTAFSDTDFFNFKVSYPTYTTNPTTVSYTVVAEFSYT